MRPQPFAGVEQAGVAILAGQVGLGAVGESNDEIASSLVISPATARTYVSRLLAKLGARDRAHLVIIAYESGLITPGKT